MGTINVSLPADGTTADVADYNTPIQTIVDEINGQLDNDNIAADAAVAGSKLATASVTPTQWTNPYAFRASDSGGTTLTDNTIVQINLATEAYDYNSNFAASAYTVPVGGVYHFDGQFTINGAVAGGVSQLAFIYVDGSAHTQGPRTTAITDGGSVVSADILLTAGQVVTFRGFQNSDGNESTDTNAGRTFFSGHLVRAT